jgi:2-polyprenyl-3-methyl-5-hydroxy-6-metoxy-1,4-benzoquinol methylase
VSSKERLQSYYDTKYNAEASAFLDQVLEHPSCPSNRFEACLKFFLSRFRNGDILELGAGSGLVARSLIAHGLKFNTYTLSELSSMRLKGLSQNFNDSRMRVISLDAESVSEEEFARYDAVIMLALIEHLIDPLGSMQRIRKLLKPGGFVFIDTPNIAKFTRRAKLLLGRFPSTASRNEGLITYEGHLVDLHDEGHLHYFTFRSLSQMLIERCGFSRVEKFGYFVGPNGQRIVGHKLADRLARFWPELFSEIVLVAYL